LCSGNTNPPFALFSTEDSKVILSPEYAAAFDSASDAVGFASSLTGGYVPAVLPDEPGASGTAESGGSSSMPPSSTSVSPAAAVPDLSTVTPGAAPSSPAPTEVTPEDPSTSGDIELSRGQSRSTTINNGDDIDVCLLDPFNSSGAYHYTFANNSGANQNVSLRYLENGRLIVTANNLDITAKSGQRDDLIIYGNNNNISTGDQDDRVRIGQVTDSMSTGTSGYLSTSNQSGNVVDTGSGNDFVIVRGSGNSVNLSGGTDDVYSIGSNTISNQERTFADLSGGVDTTLDWTQQRGYGDCKFLSFLNSLKSPLSSFLSINRNSANNGYEVKFNSLQSAPSGSIYEPYKTINVYDSELSSALSTRSQGDKTNIIVEAAFLKVISAIDHVDFSESGTNTFGNSRNDYLLSKYFFGLDTAGEDRIDKSNPDRFKNILQKYLSGQVSNLVVAVTSGNTLNAANGIMGGHAYAVKSATSDGSGGYSSIQLVNPHDSRDVINLTWSDFLNCFDSVILYGDTYNMYVDTLGYNTISCPSNTALTDCNSIDLADFADNRSSNNEPEANVPSVNVTSSITPSNDSKFEALYYLWYAIRDFGYTKMDSNALMKNPEYLTNVLEGGFGFLKMYNKDERKWVDTSISTNTTLREIQDEKDLRRAEAKYESDMRRIDFKDRKYDSDLAAVESERSAIKEEIDTLKTVAKDNCDRTFKLFS
jgi:hypothetical protein